MDCADGDWGVGPADLADDGAGEVSIADVDFVGLFCLPRRHWKAAFAVGL